MSNAFDRQAKYGLLDNILDFDYQHIISNGFLTF